MTRETFEAGIAYEGERLDKYLNLIFSETDAAQSRSFFQKLIKEGHVLVNDTAQKANYRLKADDMICVEIPDAVQTPILPENIPLDILYEDDDLLVVNKPKGMVVHPSAGHYTGTLVNAIMYHCRDSLSGINGEIRPGIVHRIDMDTTGSLIVCKNVEPCLYCGADQGTFREPALPRHRIRCGERGRGYRQCADRTPSHRAQENGDQ